MPQIEPQFTAEEIEDFNQKFDAWFEARGRYNALESQGRFCPPEVLKGARLASAAAGGAYMATRVYKERQGRGTHSNLYFYRLCAMIRRFREQATRQREETP